MAPTDSEHERDTSAGRRPFDSGFPGWNGGWAGPGGSAARRVYVRFNETRSSWRRQPSWLQRAIGLAALLVMVGLLAVLLVVGLFVGAAALVAGAIGLGIARLARLVPGHSSAMTRRGGEGRENVRVLPRR